MEHVYIIIENGIAYDRAFTTYNLAINEVKIKHYEILEEQEKECNEFKMQNCSEVNIREHESGKTDLYIEKQIYITIYKLPIILK